MKILKFGGTSVGSAERMQALVALIGDGKPKIVVLSAMSGTTNNLVEICSAFTAKKIASANKRIKALEKKYLELLPQLFSSNSIRLKGESFLNSVIQILYSMDADEFGVLEEKLILAQGEILSTNLFQLYLEERKTKSALLNALEFMKTDETGEPMQNYTKKKIKKLLHTFPDHTLFITQGYICRDSFGNVSNLGRGGSDYSASLIGAAVNAEEIQIWTDIDGMHNNDPRVVDKTFPVAELSFDEAAELAYFGAKILHPSSILPAKQKNIQVRLLNTLQPEKKGTIITAKSSGNNIKAVAAKDGIIAVNIKSSRMLLAYGFLRSVFEVFERFKTPIDVITTSEVAVSLTIDNEIFLDEIKSELESFGNVSIDRGMSIICIVGDFLGTKTGYAIQVFESLQNIPIRMVSYGGSQNNISFVIKSQDKKRALDALNKGLFPAK